MKKLINNVEIWSNFSTKKQNNFPLKIISSNYPIGIHYEADVSAQLKSAVILAGLNSYGLTSIIEGEKSRDHTENILSKNKQSIKIKMEKKNNQYFRKNNLNSFNLSVPGDPSSAAFFCINIAK